MLMLRSATKLFAVSLLLLAMTSAAFCQDIATLKRQADAGDAVAQAHLGNAYYFGKGVPQDYAQSFIWYRKAAEQGYAEGQFGLGNAYYKGEGVPQDYAQSFVWFRKAAEQGGAGAQYSLGRCYELGEGVPQDFLMAAVWYRKAAEQGNAQAQSYLGNAYNMAQGVQQNYAESAMWYRKAADQGDAMAQYNLGISYSQGEGVPQDDLQATIWDRKSADQGLASAQYLLGLRYDLGKGVPQDYAEAYFWYDLAAASGRLKGDLGDGAIKCRDLDASRLTSELLSQMQARARVWSESHHYLGEPVATLRIAPVNEAKNIDPVIPAAAAHKSPANYPETFYVRHMVSFDGCVMNVSEGNVEYGLIDGGLLSSICFSVGQTLQGRFLGNRVEILYTDSKGREKTVKYQIVSERAF